MTGSSTAPPITIAFGEDTRWELKSVPSPTVFPQPAAARVADIDRAVREALEQPISFPSLDQAVVPGDRLAFAIDPSLPALPEVVSAAVAWFTARGINPENMVAVVADKQTASAQSLRDALARHKATSIAVEAHDPDDASSIAYVAANDASDPIYMNRSLVDADVVIPIVCARVASALDYFGAYSIFPLLSDRATRGRFYSLPKLNQSTPHQALRQWADQAAWWLGLMVSIQVVPAGQAQITSVLAGQSEPLEAASQARMSAVWSNPTQASDIVIALIDAASIQQNWLTFARALHSATKCATPGGTIVICSTLSESLGSSLRKLRQTHASPAAIAKQLAKDNQDDAIAASVVLRAVRDHHIFLVSELKKESVESLGVGVIESPEQLSRLVGQHASCTILRSAQYWCAAEPSP